MAIDCISNLKDRYQKGGPNIHDPFATATQNPAWDDLCPFPNCAYGYKFDERVFINETGNFNIDPRFWIWEPQSIPRTVTDLNYCIIRNPNPFELLYRFNCSHLDTIYCDIPNNSQHTSSKKKRDTVNSSQTFKVKCSDLPNWQCQYLTNDGNITWDSCDKVYITEPYQSNALYPDQSQDYNFPLSQPYARPAGGECHGACVRYIQDKHYNGPRWLFHVPYTSMLHCLADQPRSTAKWCTSIFQRTYYECKRGAGLLNGG